MLKMLAVSPSLTQKGCHNSMHYIHYTHSFMQRKEYLLLWESKPHPDFLSGPTEQKWVICPFTSYKLSWETKYQAFSTFSLRAGLCQKEENEGYECLLGRQSTMCPKLWTHVYQDFCYIFTAPNYNSLKNSLNQFIFCLTKYLYLGRKFYMPTINSKPLLGTFSILY